MNEEQLKIETTAEKPKRKTHTSTAVKRRYADKVYTRIRVDVRKELAADFKAAVQANNTSVAAVVKAAIQRYVLENPIENPDQN